MKQMNIAVISGNSRKDSESLKVSKWFEGAINATGDQAQLIDLHASQLPLEIDLLWDEDPVVMALWTPIQKILQDVDAYVIVSPEWNGMLNASLVNLFTYVDKEMAHKPVLVATVSASAGGAYPSAMLKGFGGKNNHLIYIPEHIIIRQVGDVFASQEPDQSVKSDVYLQKRARYSLDMLKQYAKALAEVRAGGVPDLETYPNGM